MFAVLWAVAASAECPEQPEAEMRTEARQVLRAFDAADASLLESARRGITSALPCLRQAPSAAALRDLHRAMAFLAFADRDREGSSRAWAALLHLQPLARPDARRFPPGHGMWRVFDAAHALEGDPVALEQRPRGGWLVDGERSNRVPAHRAFLLSARSRHGALVHTDYHYRPSEVGRLDLEALDPRPGPGPGQVASLATGAGLVVAGAVTLTSAALLERDLLGGGVSPGRVLEQQTMTNRRYAVGGVLTGTGVVLGTIGLSIRW